MIFVVLWGLNTAVSKHGIGVIDPTVFNRLHKHRVAADTIVGGALSLAGIVLLVPRSGELQQSLSPSLRMRYRAS